MDTVLERLLPGARVAVLRLRSLGDCVLTTPALHLLKKARPDLQVAIIVEDRFAAIFDGNPDVGAILLPAASELRRWRPDLTLNLHGGSLSARLTVLSRARLRAGFAHFRFRFLYNLRFPTAQEILGVKRKVHTAEHLASAMFWLGVPHAEIPRARLFSPPSEFQHAYAILHPKASSPEKTWSAANFLAIARHLRDSLDLEPLFIAGPGESLAEFAEFRCISGAPLRRTMSLISGAKLFIGNDSGPAHIAAAFGVPSLVFFGASDPEIWRPWKADSSTVLSSPDLSAVEVEQARESIENLHVRLRA